MNSLYKQACNLSNVWRFSRLRLSHEYNVAEHSYRVAILSMMIVDDYNNENHSQIDTEEVLKKALLHDIEESYIGDIPGPAKRRLPQFKDAYNRLGQLVVSEDILVDAPNPTEYFNAWLNDKTGESGEVVKLADMLEMLYTTRAEMKRSNMDEIKEAHDKAVEWFESTEGIELRIKFPLADKLYKTGKF